MARMIPPTIVSGTPTSERRVFEALSRLDDEWTVLHSVKWQSKRNGRQGDGEADFLLIHQTRGILILEVKGGDVDLRNGSWFSVNTATRVTSRIKDPFQQAVASKHALLGYLEEHQLPMKSIPIAHAVAFPGVTLAKGQTFGPAAPLAIVWDRVGIDDIPRSLETTCRHWNMMAIMTAQERSRIVQLLAPTTSVRRRLVDEIGDIEKRLLQLTEEQKYDFAILRRLRRAQVRGGAGTGKTVLAVARARQLAEDGFSTLLVCYNECLGRTLAEEIADDERIWAGTFHSLCLSTARAAGLSVPRPIDENWWFAEAPNLLIEAQASVGKKAFQAVVVDEGQDFPPDWLQALDLVIGDVPDPPFYLFADSHQQLYLDDWRAPDGMPPPLELRVNCRSTIAIAQYAANVFGEMATTRGIVGPNPQLREVANRREMVRGIQRLAETLIEREGVTPADIVVLADTVEILDAMKSLSAGSIPFVGEGEGIKLETVRRFKGLESNVVILALSERIAEQELLALAYTGMSRAKTALYVFASAKIRDGVRWPH